MAVFIKNMTDNSPKFKKRNPQIEEITGYTYIYIQIHTVHAHKSTPRHIAVKLHNTKGENKIFKTVREKSEIVIEAVRRLTANFL